MKKTDVEKHTGHVDRQYLRLMQNIYEHGTVKKNRTGIDTKSIFGTQMRFDLSDGFPLLTTKKVHTKSIIYELLWFLRGDTNIKYLTDNGVTIWNEWADKETGDLGPVYGKQWVEWKTADGQTINQIAEAVWKIKNKPDDRRIIVSAWNVGEIPKMKLAPCHCLFHFEVSDGKLSCLLYQRSCDFFIGVPFNIASYALLTMMVAQVTGLKPGDFIWTGGDTHLYVNHFEQVQTQLARANDIRPMPTMWINPEVIDIFGFQYEDFKLLDYNPHPTIKAPIAV